MAFTETDFDHPVRHNPELHEIVAKTLREWPPGRILDIPSGPGYLLKEMQEDGFSGVAAEIDTSLHCLPGIEFATADMTQPLPFPDACFDYVASIEGIEHIADPFLFLREVRRVLKPSGKLVLTTPNIGSLESRWHFLASGFHLMEERPIPLDTENIYFEHINPISFSQLYFACERSGLHPERLLTSRMRRGSYWLYYALYPLWRLGIWRACFRKEKDPGRRRQNQRLYRWLVSRENLLGAHTIIVASAR